jgi:hypothetical protein
VEVSLHCPGCGERLKGVVHRGKDNVSLFCDRKCEERWEKNKTKEDS